MTGPSIVNIIIIIIIIIAILTLGHMKFFP